MRASNFYHDYVSVLWSGINIWSRVCHALLWNFSWDWPCCSPNDRSTTRPQQGAWWKRWWSAWEKAPAPAESASASSDPRKNRRTSSSEPSHILPMHFDRIMSQPIWIPKNGLNGELIPWCCYSRVTGITAKKAADPNQSSGTYDLHQHSTKVMKSKLILASLASWWILYTSIICILYICVCMCIIHWHPHRNIDTQWYIDIDIDNVQCTFEI